MANKSIILCLVFCSICAFAADKKPRKLPMPMPPMPWTAGAVSSEPIPKLIEAPGMPRISIWWTNQAVPPSTPAIETVLQSSTNLRTWLEVGVYPYTNVVRLTLSNRPPAEYYRVYHRWKTTTPQ